MLDIDEANIALDLAFPNKNWAGKCEAVRYQLTRLTNGLGTMQSFDSANTARKASTIISLDRTAATAGQVGFWNKTVYGHDMIALGSDLWVGATDLGERIGDLGGGIRIIRGASYPATFLGFTDKVGSNPKASIRPFLIPVPPPTPTPVPWAVNLPGASVQKRIQVALRKRGRYNGVQNGIFGTLSWKGIQRTVANVGYSGPQNGIPGERTCHFIQVYAARFGRYSGPINSILGPNSWEGFARGLEAGLR